MGLLYLLGELRICVLYPRIHARYSGISSISERLFETLTAFGSMPNPMGFAVLAHKRAAPSTDSVAVQL